MLSIHCSEKWTFYVSKPFYKYFPQFTSWMERDLSFTAESFNWHQFTYVPIQNTEQYFMSQQAGFYFKTHAVMIQVLYLFVKRLSKAFICSPTKKYWNRFWSGKKISTGSEKKTKAFVKKWSKMKQIVNFMN